MLTFIFWILFLLWIMASVVLVMVVLVQSGKGGGLSGLVGAGSSLGDHLGATGAEKTLNRWTSYCAVGFLVLNIALVFMAPKVFKESLIDKVQTVEEAPLGEEGAMDATPLPESGDMTNSTEEAAPAASETAEAPVSESVQESLPTESEMLQEEAAQSPAPTEEAVQPGEGEAPAENPTPEENAPVPQATPAS